MNRTIIRLTGTNIIIRRTFFVIILMLFTISTFGLLSCVDKKDQPKTPVEIQADIIGRWQYNFPQNYDPEIAYFDPTATNVKINGKQYLILSFGPVSGPNNSRIFIFDTENSVSPRLISTFTRAKQGRDTFLVRSMTVQNNILYASLFVDKGLWMVDISDPANPRDLGITTVGGTSGIVVQGDNAYMSGQMYNGISVSNISDPQHVAEITRLDISSRDSRFTVNGKFLYLGFQQNITIFDIYTPASPVKLSSYEMNVPDGLVKQLPNSDGSPFPWDKFANISDLQVSGDYLYVSFGAGQLRVINVSDPRTPKEVANLSLGGYAIALTIKDNLLYMTKAANLTSNLTMCIVDISQPQTPKLLDSVQTESPFGFSASSFARPQVVDNYVYIAGLHYMDVIETRKP